jgi:hypothetical protein
MDIKNMNDTKRTNLTKKHIFVENLVDANASRRQRRRRVKVFRRQNCVDKNDVMSTKMYFRRNCIFSVISGFSFFCASIKYFVSVTGRVLLMLFSSKKVQ